MFRLLLTETQTPAHDLPQAEFLSSFIGHTLLASLATLSANDCCLTWPTGQLHGGEGRAEQVEPLQLAAAS